MLQDITSFISNLDPVLIYFILFFVAYIENILPPAPADVIILIGSSLITNSPIGFLPILIVTSIGSGLGFITMYLIGEFFGTKILRTGKIKFLKQEYLQKADKWFHKYGYKIIIINRFLPGTRAVVSFFAGVHRLKPMRTFTLAVVSSFLWNAILIFLGMILGKNINLVDKYISDYSTIALIITVLVVITLIIIHYKKKKRIDSAV